METRVYYVVGDIAANASAGAVVGLVSAMLVGDTWPPLVAMGFGMVVGGGVAMVLAMIASSFFGAFEVMLPVMTTGMIVGMMAAMSGASLITTAVRGAVTGLGVLAATYGLNARLRAQGGTWTS